MKPILYILTICLFTSGLYAQQSPANIRLKDVTLMHEMRATPSPLDKVVVADRIVSFQWPLQEGLYVGWTVWIPSIKLTRVKSVIACAILKTPLSRPE